MDVGSVTASESRDEFLQLLVTQLRHQDPLDPIKQENFLSQLAQFSTLEGIEKLNGRFEEQLAVQEEVLKLQQISQAADFVGREITYRQEVAVSENETELVNQRGIVESVSLDNAKLQLQVGGANVTLDQVVGLHPMANLVHVPAGQEKEPDQASQPTEADRLEETESRQQLLQTASDV